MPNVSWCAQCGHGDCSTSDSPCCECNRFKIRHGKRPNKFVDSSDRYMRIQELIDAVEAWRRTDVYDDIAYHNSLARIANAHDHLIMLDGKPMRTR